MAVSIEVVSWALNLAPVPRDRDGRPSSACAFVLVGLANHASNDGTISFPSVATLMRYTRLSERTIRTTLDRLEAEGIITRCDPDIVAAHIKRRDRRPQGWNLNTSLIRDDLTGDDLASLERTFPGITASYGVQPLHPVAVRGATDDGTGCNPRSNGVQSTQQRGATIAPEPSLEPSIEPSKEPLGRFDEFWLAYPRKTGRGHAKKMWTSKVLKANVDQQTVIDAVARYTQECITLGRSDRYMKHPGTWLNGECWLDAPIVNTKPNTAPVYVDVLESPDNLDPNDTEAYVAWQKGELAQLLAEREARV